MLQPMTQTEPEQQLPALAVTLRLLSNFSLPGLIAGLGAGNSFTRHRGVLLRPSLWPHLRNYI